MVKLMTVFSEFEFKDCAVKFLDDDSATFQKIGCVGSIEEEMECKKVIKKCEGVVAKSVTRGTGNGTLKMVAHINYDLYIKMHGMENPKLVDGVYSYGTSSRHERMSLVGRAENEDGDTKYKAYPNCIVETGPARKIENGGEEVVETELTITVNPDEEGNGLYEAPDTLLDTTVKSKWMTEFTPSLVKKTGEV